MSDHGMGAAIEARVALLVPELDVIPAGVDTIGIDEQGGDHVASSQITDWRPEGNRFVVPLFRIRPAATSSFVRVRRPDTDCAGGPKP